MLKALCVKKMFSLGSFARNWGRIFSYSSMSFKIYPKRGISETYKNSSQQFASPVAPRVPPWANSFRTKALRRIICAEPCKGLYSFMVTNVYYQFTALKQLVGCIFTSRNLTLNNGDAPLLYRQTPIHTLRSINFLQYSQWIGPRMARSRNIRLTQLWWTKNSKFSPHRMQACPFSLKVSWSGESRNRSILWY